jgi:peptide/nickel transport system ATP-binding protein
MPGLKALPPGCRFHPRCGVAEPRCAAEVPVLRPAAAGQIAACHLVTS